MASVVYVKPVGSGGKAGRPVYVGTGRGGRGNFRRVWLNGEVVKEGDGMGDGMGDGWLRRVVCRSRRWLRLGDGMGD